MLERQLGITAWSKRKPRPHAENCDHVLFLIECGVHQYLDVGSDRQVLQ